MYCLYYTYIIHVHLHIRVGNFVILNPGIKEFHPVPMYSFKFPIHIFKIKQGEEKQ